MQHQHHVEMIERLALKGIVIARSSFPMKSVPVRIEFRSDDVKDLLAGELIEKQYICSDCGGTDEYKFIMRKAGEEPEWTIRTGKAPPGAEEIVRGKVGIERIEDE